MKRFLLDFCAFSCVAMGGIIGLMYICSKIFAVLGCL